MAHLDRARASRLMQEAEIDALVLLTPESFTYATGAPAGVATMWRRAGAVAAIVPADPSLSEAALVSDLFLPAFRAASHIEDVSVQPLWVETADLRGLAAEGDAAELVREAFRRQGRYAGFARPETFDAAGGFAAIAQLLDDRRLEAGRIGVEMADISALELGMLRRALPNAEMCDASEVVRRLKMVKSESEIGHLRTAVQLAEAGIAALQAAVHPGASRADLAAAWRAGAAAEAERRAVGNLTGMWEYVSVGPDPWSGGGIVKKGALIKVDVGCLVAGYTSDSGRTFVFGEPSALQRRIFGALHSAFCAGLAEIRPGRLLSDVHRAASAAMASAGFPDYSRGHFGHGLGASLGSEEWPFISASAHVPIEPGMVLAFETPWYIDGVGGFIIENQLLVTADGHEVMNRLPEELVLL